jgi:hypothetical protein
VTVGVERLIGDCWCCTIGFRTVWNKEILYLFKNRIRRTMILSVVLYGYETWSLTLREERMLRALESRVLRGIFGHI